MEFSTISIVYTFVLQDWIGSYVITRTFNLDSNFQILDQKIV